jgi:transposase
MRKDRHDGASYRRLELITGSKRRRARSAREKAAIVAETFAPGANVSEIARRHGLNRGLLVTWRRQVRRALPGPVAEAASEGGRGPAFVPVEIEGADGWPAGPTVSNARSPTPLATAPMIEIVMATMTVRVPSGVDAATLATVMATVRALMVWTPPDGLCVPEWGC